jgi:hypothetical protein
MGKTVGIFSMSGEGKTTSTIVNPDGKYDFTKEGYNGMDPKTHFIINCDKKELPFPGNMWCAEEKNYASTSDYDSILKCIDYCAKTQEIKSVSIDTINSYLTFKEFNDRKKMTFDQWRDLALDIVELINLCNTKLRKDQIAYLFGHVELITDVNGEEKKVLATTGKKLKKIFPESLLPIVLFGRVDGGLDGDNTHYFETKSSKSTAKTPIGMFPNFLIPNSLKLVDSSIRSYYKI